MSINLRIKEVRKSLELSQQEFARRLGVTQPSLSDIEKGKTENIDPRNIKIICAEFNVNEEWLRTGKGAMFNESTLKLAELLGEKINSLTDFQINAIKELISLPPEHLEIIRSFINKLNK
jgi:transcriptional regulator with XRE-family HTH domain